MDANKTTIPLNGINRSQSYNISTDGDMEEIINLRKKDGSLEVIGDFPVKLKHNDGTPVDISKYIKIFLHKTDNYTHYIAIKYVPPYQDIDPTYKVCYLKETNDYEEIQIISFDPSYKYTISSINNFLLISYYNDNEAFKKIALFNNEYKIVDLEDINISVKLETTLEEVKRFYNNPIYLEPDVTGVEPRTYDKVTNNFSKIFIEKFDMIKDEIERVGYPFGYYTWRYAIKLFDGSYIKISPPMLSTIGYDSVYSADSQWIEESSNNAIIDTETRITTPYATIQSSIRRSIMLYLGDRKYISVSLKNLFIPCLSMKYIIKTNTDISHLEDLIIGLDIFMSPVTSIYERDQNKIKDQFLKEYDPSQYTQPVYTYENNNLPSLLKALYKKEEDIMNEIIGINSEMYKIHSFKQSEIYHDSFKIIDSDIRKDSIATGQKSPSEKINYTEIGKENYKYNQKIHTFNILSFLSNKNNASDYQLIKPKVKPRYDNADPLTLSYIEEYKSLLISKFENTFLRGIDSIIIKIYYKKLGSEILTTYYPPFISIENTSLTKIAPISPFILFQDLDAEKIEFIVKNYTGTYYKMQETASIDPPGIIKIPIELKESDTYNGAISFKTLQPLKFSPIEISIDDPTFFENKNVVHPRRNILKVSEINNPLVFNEEQTYSIGSGKIIALYSNTKPISTGQFGEYPLIALCSDGRWALGLGSGAVDYSSIKPISRDVYNKDETKDTEPISQLDDAIVFSTERGLLISSGETVEEISQIIEGTPFMFSEPGLDYIDIIKKSINNNLLVQLEPSISKIKFKEYLKDANIGFIYGENREIIISNPNQEYSYIYSIETQSWYKNNLKIKYFINDYPYLYACIDGKLIDLTAETPTSAKDTFFLTKPIKLNDIDFKRGYRAVLRSLIKPSGTTYCGFYVFGSEDGHLWRFLGGTEFDGKIQTGAKMDFRDIGCTIERTSVKYLRIAFSGKIKSGSKLDFIDISAKINNTFKLT